jgi:hypothetical protein
MDYCSCEIMSQLKHVICPVCEKGILTIVAEVGIEAEGTTVKFQSLSAAQGRVYKMASEIRHVNTV